MKKYLALLICSIGVSMTACTGDTKSNNTPLNNKTNDTSTVQNNLTNQPNTLNNSWSIKAAAIRSAEYLFNINITGTVCDMIFSTILDLPDEGITDDKIMNVENSLVNINNKLNLLLGEFSQFETEWRNRTQATSEHNIYINMDQINSKWELLHNNMRVQPLNNGQNSTNESMTLTQYYEQNPESHGEKIKTILFSGSEALSMTKLHSYVIQLTDSSQDSNSIIASQALGQWLTAVSNKYIAFKSRSQIAAFDIANENSAYDSYLRKTIMQIAISVDKAHSIENQVMELYCKHPEEFKDVPNVFTFDEADLSSDCLDKYNQADGGQRNLNILNSYYKNYTANLMHEVTPNIKSFKQIESTTSISDKIKYSSLLPPGSYLQSCHMLESNAGIFKTYNGDSITIVCFYNGGGKNAESIELSYPHVADCTNNGGLQLTKDSNNNYILACQNGYQKVMPCNNISKDDHHNCIIEEKENIDSYYDLPTQYSLYQGQEWDGPNGDRLAMQTDGNLVFYNNSSLPIPLQGLNIQKMIFQPNDGNLVRYSEGGGLYALPDGHYDTNEGATDRAQLVLQDDGNLVTYNPGQDTWSLKQDPSSN